MRTQRPSWQCQGLFAEAISCSGSRWWNALQLFASMAERMQPSCPAMQTLTAGVAHDMALRFGEPECGALAQNPCTSHTGYFLLRVVCLRALEVLSACDKGGEWLRALSLLQAWHKQRT